MIGKKNIVFGFLYLVLCAALGNYMVATQYDVVNDARNLNHTRLSELHGIVNEDLLNQELQQLTIQRLAQKNTGAILALSASLDSRDRINAIKSGPHTHGNLEAMLNIVVGLALCFIAASPKFKQIISWTFIAGTILHSGMLYLVTVFGWSWAIAVTTSPFAIFGPLLLLIGLALTGIAALLGFRGEPVRDTAGF